MKMKDVCKQTGLTERTIRFYTEKKLITPLHQWVNGRIYTEYSREHILELIDIANLRKAGFTIQDIQEMQNSPHTAPDILSKHCSLLTERCNLDKQLIGELSALQEKENMNWRSIAAGLFQTRNEIIFEPDFSRFDEPLDTTLPEKPVMHLRLVLIPLLCIVLLLGMYSGFLHVYNQRPLISAFALSEVTFHEVWLDGTAFAIISTNPNAPFGFDEYFFTPQTIHLESEDYYEAIQTGDKPYTSVTVQISIPYIHAKKQNLLNDQNTLSIEKVLENEEYVQSYCTIVHIHR